MSCKVLVVEDDPAIRNLLRWIFERAGYTVDDAPHGGVALELLRLRPRPDVVVTDVMMPVMDGLLMVERIRSDPGMADLPILVLTSSLDNAIAARAASMADAVLGKPFTVDRILETVRSVVAPARERSGT